MAEWWDRFTYAADRWADRVAEKAGVFDVIEEFSRFDDDDMSAADWIGTALKTGRHVAELPFEILSAGGEEANLLAGTALREAEGRPLGLLNPLFRFTGPGAGETPAFRTQVMEDYFTGGVSRQELANMPQGTEEEQKAARLGYEPASFGDFYMVGVDKAVNRWGRGVLAVPLAWPYGITGTTDGVQSNQSVLPASFDLYAENAGLQLAEYGPWRSKWVMGQFMGEILLDPTNWLAGPIAAALAGLRAAKIGTSVRVATQGMPDATHVAASLDGVMNGAVDQQRFLRMRQMTPGKGTWDPYRMLNEFRNPKMRAVLEQLARTTDRGQIRRWLVDRRMADGDGADSLSTLLAHMDTPEDAAAVLYAGAYRDPVAIQRVLDKLQAKDNFPAINALNANTGLVQNALEAAPFRFGDGLLPKGHMLNLNSKQFVNDAIDGMWGRMSQYLPEGTENTIRKQWDALAEQEQADYLSALGKRRGTMQAAQKTFRDAESSVDFPLQRMANPRGNLIPFRDPVALRRLERAGELGDLRPGVRAANWLHKITPAIKINGRPLRTSATVWLLSRPGLTFSLHGLDAVSKFDDLIHYTDGILGPRPMGQRFVDDEVVKGLRDRFIGAGAVTRSPEQLRAELVDELQHLMLERVAINRGADPAAAKILADEGMAKAKGAADALNAYDSGYTTVANQGSLPLILANHASTIRQTPNHIPIMDLKAVDDALKSKGLQAYHNPDHMLSNVEARISTTDVKKELAKFKSDRDRLSLVGRGLPTRITHHVIDVMDQVNTIFKMEVLFRLGYPVRNLAEAHLSAFASGVGWLDTLAAAGLTPSAMKFMLGNFATNMHFMPARIIDRWQVSRGKILSEGTLASGARAYTDGMIQVTNSLMNVNRIASDPAEMTRLADVILTGTQEERAAAIVELNWLNGQRMRAALHLDPDHELVKAGVVRHDAKQSRVLWHSDTTGALNGELTPGNLSGPISTTVDRVPAQAMVDSGWTTGDTWQNVDVSLGKVKGSLRVPGRRFTGQQSVAMQNMYNDLIQGGSRPKWSVSNRTGNINIPSGAAWDEFVHDINAFRMRPGITRPELVVLNHVADRVQNAAKWTLHQRGLSKQARTHHVQYRKNASMDWVDWTGPLEHRGGRAFNNYEFRTIARPENGGKPSTVRMESWGPEVDFNPVSNTSAVVQALLKQYPEQLDWQVLIDAAINDDRAAQLKLSQVLAKDGIYRIRFPERNPNWRGDHVMVHPDGVGEAALARLANKHTEELVKVRMQQKLGPKGKVDVPLLTQADRRVVKKWNEEEAEVPTPVSEKLPQRTVVNKSTGEEELVVNKLTEKSSVKDILERGGFEAVMEELVESAAHLRSQRDTLVVRYLERRRHLGRIAKRPSLPSRQLKMYSLYDDYYKVWDHLSGGDGGAFAKLASADMTQAQVYGVAAHNVDLLSELQRAMMNPQELHPGDPRFWEGQANLLGRQYRDTPGAVTPTGEVTQRDIDPVFLRALESGDRERILDETIDWALRSNEGRAWVQGLGLKTAKDVEAAKIAAEVAQARRGAIPPLTDADYRKTVHQNWQDRLGDIPVKDVDVADVIKASFAFADSHLPTQAVRDLFLSGNLTAETLRAAYQAEPWELRAFNGLVTPTHPAYRAAMRQRNMNDAAMEKFTGGLIKVLGKGLQKIASGPETRLARHPVYLAIGKKDLQQRINFAEATLGRPVNMDELLSMRSASQKFALKKMEETLYTLKSRSSVDDFLRFVMPFFPAWRNTLHRWGKFAMENPGGVAQTARLYENTIGEMVWYDSATGAEVDPDSADPNEVYTLLPPVSIIPKLMHWNDDPAMQESMRATRTTKKSFDFVFQGEAFNPGAGPFMAVPMQALMNHLPGLFDGGLGKEIASWILPVGPAQTGSEFWDAFMAFMPSALKPVVASVVNLQGHVSTRNRYAANYHANGYQFNPDGTQKSPEQIDGEISDATRKLQGIKVLSYLVSPVSAQQIGDAEFYAGQMRSLRETSPDDRTAEMLFLERFGSDRWFYTESSTFNLTGGMATAQTVANQKADTELAHVATDEYDDPRLLGFTDNLGPNGELQVYDPETYSPSARNWQMHNAPGVSDEAYRGGKGFAEFKDDAAVSLGWRFYDRAMATLDLQLAKEGYLQGSPEFTKERANRAPGIAAAVGQAVPQWEAGRSVVDTAKTERNADYFTWLVNDSQWAKDPKRANWAVLDSMRGYLEDRETARAMIERNKLANPRGGSTLTATANAPVAAWLQARRELYSQGSASFRDWVDRYFRNDRISYEAEAAEPLEAITQ